MSRTPSRFTQAEIARALRAIEQTGMDMEVQLMPNGMMRIARSAPSGDSHLKVVEEKPPVVL